MPDAELAQALKLAKTRKMFYAFIPKSPDGRLILSKTKIPMKDILELKKEISGGTPVSGTCFGPPDDMTFEVGKPVSGSTENYLIKIAKRDAGLNIGVTIVTAKDLVSDATTMDKEDAKIPPPLPLPQIGMKPGAELDQLTTLAETLDSIEQIKGEFPDGPHFNITMQGKKYELSQKEADANRKNAKASFAKAIQLVRNRASNSQDEYDIYRKTMTTGWFGTVATFVFDHVSVTDPGGRVAILVGIANAETAAAQASANGNSFVSATKSLIAADEAAQTAHKLTMAYKNGLERSAGTTVTVLEGVKTASEMTLAVGGVVVTGGATVAFAGSMAITAAGDLAPALVGDKINWGKFAFDMALGVVMKKLGPGDAMEKVILGKLGPTAIEKVGEKAAKEAFAKVMANSGEALMKKSVETVQKKLSGKEVTWDEFGNETKTEMEKSTAIEVAKILLKR